MTCTQKSGPWSSSISIRSLEHLFQPGSVAVISASDRPQSLVATPLRNLLEGGFAGPIWPVKPKHFVSPDDNADVEFWRRARLPGQRPRHPRHPDVHRPPRST